MRDAGLEIYFVPGALTPSIEDCTFREMLEFTRRPVDQIAWSVGYEDAGTFRKLFHRIIGLSPSDYRQRFGVASAAA